MLFAHPTVAGCAESLEQAPPLARARISPQPFEQWPLSAAQKQMWFLAQLTPEDTSYNLPYAIRANGLLDPDRLRRAFDEVVAGHAALRSQIVTVDGQPMQRVVSRVPLAIPLVDLRGSGDRAWDDLTRRAGELAAIPIDLAVAPLHRARLFRLGASDWALLIVVHHSIFDEWSLSVLVRDLAEAYERDGRGHQPAAIHDLNVLSSVVGNHWAEALAYWREELRVVPPVVSLPVNKKAPHENDTSGAVSAFVLDEPLSRAIETLAAGEGVTEYMLLLAAFQVLLTALTGQRDFVTLTAFSGRGEPEIDAAIGCFFNMVPIRADVRESERFRTLLTRVRSRVLEALDRQTTPIDAILEELRLPRDAHRAPFSQVAFGVQNVPCAVAACDGCSLEGFELRPERTRFDLSVWADRRRGPIRFEWTFRTALFEAASIARFHDQLATLLRRIVETPDAPVSALLAAENVSALAARKKLPQRLVPKTFSQDNLATLENCALGDSLPASIRAREVGLNLAEWACAHLDTIDQHLRTVGGLLLRGFRVESAADFRHFAQTISSHLIRYGERSSPRTEIADGVYTSTDHPPDQPIVLHNEQSYTLNWPMRILFYCARPALERGRTPLADSRRVLARLSRSTVERFERLGVLYVRNYLEGIGLPWSVAFQTDDRRDVEAYCRASSVEVEWLERGRLRTRQVRPAIRVHPHTGERTWFNHALFFHVTSLPLDVTRSLMATLREEDLPYNTFYGDGSPIRDETLRELREAYRAEAVSFPWERGDVLVLDNMLVAHGREPFLGEREILAAMVDPYRGPARPTPGSAEATS